jgi:hypothetical protein
VTVVAAKRKKAKAKKGSEWSWRLAGLALCAFFALGVTTGLSGSGHLFAQRAQFLFRLGTRLKRAALAPSAVIPTPPRPTGNSVALVKHVDGFYALDAAGDLRGPAAPTAEPDMPILSGAAVANASGMRLVEYAATLVRAEAGLGVEISEMRVDTDEGATLYLDRPALTITIEFAHAAAQVEEATRVLAIWRGHRDLLVALDMTVPGQAVARLRPAAFAAIRRGAAGRSAVTPDRRVARGKALPEVTASR